MFPVAVNLKPIPLALPRSIQVLDGEGEWSPLFLVSSAQNYNRAANIGNFSGKNLSYIFLNKCHVVLRFKLIYFDKF